MVKTRVITCLENLEMSGNLEHVRDVVNSQGNVREKTLSWKSVPKLFIRRRRKFISPNRYKYITIMYNNMAGYQRRHKPIKLAIL